MLTDCLTMQCFVKEYESWRRHAGEQCPRHGATAPRHLARHASEPELQCSSAPLKSGEDEDVNARSVVHPLRHGRLDIFPAGASLSSDQLKPGKSCANALTYRSAGA